jgi:hypothetical protein
VSPHKTRARLKHTQGTQKDTIAEARAGLRGRFPQAAERHRWRYKRLDDMLRLALLPPPRTPLTRGLQSTAFVQHTWRFVSGVVKLPKALLEFIFGIATQCLKLTFAPVAKVASFSKSCCNDLTLQGQGSGVHHGDLLSATPPPSSYHVSGCDASCHRRDRHQLRAGSPAQSVMSGLRRRHLRLAKWKQIPAHIFSNLSLPHPSLHET